MTKGSKFPYKRIVDDWLCIVLVTFSAVSVLLDNMLWWYANYEALRSHMQKCSVFIKPYLNNPPTSFFFQSLTASLEPSRRNVVNLSIQAALAVKPVSVIESSQFYVLWQKNTQLTAAPGYCTLSVYFRTMNVYLALQVNISLNSRGKTKSITTLCWSYEALTTYSGVGLSVILLEKFLKVPSSSTKTRITNNLKWAHYTYCVTFSLNILQHGPNWLWMVLTIWTIFYLLSFEIINQLVSFPFGPSIIVMC